MGLGKEVCVAVGIGRRDGGVSKARQQQHEGGGGAR